MESISEMIAWGLLTITLYIAINRAIRVDKLHNCLNLYIETNKKLKEVINEKDLEVGKYLNLLGELNYVYCSWYY